MKKLYVILALFTLFCSSFLFGCEKPKTLDTNVVELRSNIFVGDSDDFNLKACYGYTKKDDIISNVLSFKLLDKESENITYSVSLKFNDQTYKQDFKLDGVKNALIANIEIDNFNENEFTVKLISSSNAEEIKMTSILPKDTISYVKALSFLELNQPDLVTSYKTQEGDFNANIIMRVIVRKEKPYWYVGIYKTDSDLKAFLLDGVTGEVLAIREIF